MFFLYLVFEGWGGARARRFAMQTCPPRDGQANERESELAAAGTREHHAKFLLWGRRAPLLPHKAAGREGSGTRSLWPWGPSNDRWGPRGSTYRGRVFPPTAGEDRWGWVSSLSLSGGSPSPPGASSGGDTGLQGGGRDGQAPGPGWEQSPGPLGRVW